MTQTGKNNSENNVDNVPSIGLTMARHNGRGSNTTSVAWLTGAAVALVALALLDPGRKRLMEVLVLLEGDWRAEFGGQDHLGAGSHLPGPLADGRQGARCAGRGGGGRRCGGGGGGRIGPLLLQPFLPAARKVSMLESLGNSFYELPDYGSLLLPYCLHDSIKLYFRLGLRSV